MLIEIYLELLEPEISISLEGDEIEIATHLEEDLDLEFWLEPELEISANIAGKYISLEE